MSDRAKVWIVDDVRMELEASSSVLRPSYDVLAFNDGAAVIERTATGVLPDVLVLDWHMEGVSGLDVLRYLRSQPATLGLPVLVFTATGDRHDLIEALSAGADDFVDKAASSEELNARVLTLVRAKMVLERAERAEAELEVLLERERRARAEAEDANRAKDLFLAMVSHELRSPLSAILGWTRLLRDGLDPARAARALDTIERNATAQARLIDDLFDTARIVTGSLHIDTLPVPLSEVVEQALETLRHRVAGGPLVIEATLQPCTVSGDAARLHQVVANLLENAVKFTPPTGRIDVALVVNGAEAVLTVSDNGPGIPPALIPHVFDRFRQGDSSITRQFGGLGLGLAIVREVVTLHGGRVTARNLQQDGRVIGALLEVCLPIVETSQGSA